MLPPQAKQGYIFAFWSQVGMGKSGAEVATAAGAMMTAICSSRR